MGLRRILHSLFVALLIACASQALAVQPDEIMRDPAQEARARGLSRELRCMVCQNQSIDDSDAPLARDLRLLVRERIAAGDSDGQVIDFLVARYGAFVLLKPRFEAQTLALWLLPPLALARRRSTSLGCRAPPPLRHRRRSGRRAAQFRGAGGTAGTPWQQGGFTRCRHGRHKHYQSLIRPKRRRKPATPILSLQTRRAWRRRDSNLEMLTMTGGPDPSRKSRRTAHLFSPRARLR